FTIPGKEITGPVTITAEWDKEFPITSADPELSDVVNDLKAGYENNDLYFKGFGQGTFWNGYDVPKRDGHRFKGIEVQVGDAAPQRHLGNDAFTIPGREITSRIKITVLWDKEFNVTSADQELSDVIGDLKAYENTDFLFNGFGGQNRYPIPIKRGYKFRGVKVKVGAFERTFGTDPFTIPKENITGPVTITAIWEPYSPITFNKDNDEEMTEVPEGEFYYKDDTFHFKGFNTAMYHRSGYKEPVKRGYKLIGLKIKNGNSTLNRSREAAYAGFDMKVEGPITITYIWEQASTITFDTDGGSEAPKLPEDEFYYTGDAFHFKGFYTGFLQEGRYGSIPTKPGYKFLGVSVTNGDEPPKQYLGDEANDGFNIDDVKGPIKITYLWEQASSITVDTDGGDKAPSVVPANKFYFKSDNFHFNGFGGGIAGFGAGYTEPTKRGYKFIGLKIKNGNSTLNRSREAAYAGFDMKVEGPITITYIWEKASTISVDYDDGSDPVTLDEIKFTGDTYKFPGVGKGTVLLAGFTDGLPLPKRRGYKFIGVKVTNNGVEENHTGNGAFDIPVNGSIKITYLWEPASTITFNTDNGGEAPKLPENEFYYKGDQFYFKGFGGWSGYAEPKREGFKFRGVKVQVGDAAPQEHQGNDGFYIDVQGPISITYLWDEDYHISLGEEGGEAPINGVFHEGDVYRFVGFGSKTLNYWPIPTKTGHKFLGVRVENGNEAPKDYLVTDPTNTRAAFDITVHGPIKITYLWKQEAEQKRGGWGFFKSEESAQGAAKAAAEIGMLLGTQAAGSMFVANGPLKLMKNAMDSFAALERSQAIQISEAQALVSQNNYFKGKTNEEILRQLLSNSELSAEDASMFLKLLSDVEIETSGEVMSYEPNTQDPSKHGKMHINYKMLRAMFLDANGNTQNIELFKVFVKHEFTHMEFSTSDNPLYKAAHNIPFLEEFLVSFSDLYVWQQAQLILPEYTNVVKFIFTNARILSIAAGISIEEAERISKLYTGLPQKEMTIELLPTVQGQLSGGSTSIQTSTLRPLSLFVANASDGSLTPASIYADKFGEAASDYATAVVEHIPSTVLVPTGYRRKMSVNVSFNGLVYDVYVRQNAQGKCFIGLKLKGGADLEQNPTAAAQNFAAAAQYFANNLNTNTVLREELNRATNLGISTEGVAMMDFVGFPSALQTSSQQQLTQQLYESGNMSQGLAGVYTAWDLEIGEENLTTIEQDIRSRQIFKLDTPEKFYSLDLKTARLTNSEFIRGAASIKKKEGATTIILNITDFDFETINSASVQENLKEIASIIRSLGLRPVIQVSINKTANYENLFRILMGLGFEGINLEAGEIENIEIIKSILEVLGQVSSENNIATEINTIHLKNKAIKDALGDLTKYNVLAIVSIDEETHAAKIDEGAQLKAKDKGYLRGRRILEQKIDAGAKNVRALLKLVLKNSSSVTPLEIREAVAQAGLTDEAVKKHIEVLCARASSDRATAATDVSVMETLGFLRGFIESYVLSQYLQAFDLSPEIFNMNASSDKQSLAIILTAALIIDSENQIFKSPSALKEFIGQAKMTFEQAQDLSSATLENLRTQMITFANSIYKQMDEERDIDTIIRTAGDNPYRKLYICLAIASDLINTVSFRKVVEETGNRAKAPVSAVRNILGAA
ncbi:MAG: hypothetical protein LBQ04_01220, partial [Endomicrobium sp.]|nr:hypothetical protein [Endomicrobium sp.]